MEEAGTCSRSAWRRVQAQTRFQRLICVSLQVRCCMSRAAARQRPEVRAFREWILDEARAATRAAANPVPRHS